MKTTDIKTERDLALFPLETFPPYIEDYIRHYNEVMEFDINAQSMTLMVHTASLLDNRITSNYRGKIVKPVIWACVVAETGTGKSAILENHTDFLLRKDTENTEQDLSYICDEATYEAIVRFSQNNNKGILMTLDELDTWIKGMDNYSKGNKAKYMGMFNKKPLKTLRSIAGQIPVEHHKVCILSFTQPKKLVSQLSSEDFDTGFSSRFLFCEQYDKGFRFENDLRLNPKYTGLLNQSLEKIWNIPPMEFVFSPDACTFFMDWYNNQAKMYLDYPLIRKYLPKLNVYGIRLAPVIHSLDFAFSDKDKIDAEMSIATIQKVTVILEFFIEQYKRMLENRYQNYEQGILDEQKPEFVKCYKSLSEERHYKYGELVDIFLSVYKSKGAINPRIKNRALFRKTGNGYIKVIANE